MGQLTFSKLQKKQYREIRSMFQQSENTIITMSEKDSVRLSEVLCILESLGYIREIGVSGCSMYEQVGDFCDFDEWHKDRVEEERKLSKRECTIAIVSAVVGALIGLIPTIIACIGGSI